MRVECTMVDALTSGLSLYQTDASVSDLGLSTTFATSPHPSRLLLLFAATTVTFSMGKLEGEGSSFLFAEGSETTSEESALAAADQTLLDTLREVGTTWEPRGTQ